MAKVATRNDRMPNSDRSSTGDGWRRDRHTRTGSSTSPTHASVSVRALVKPQCSACTTASSTSATPSTLTGTPMKSSRPASVSTRDSARKRRPSTTTATPKGTAAQKIPRQPNSSISRAPVDGPTAPPNPATADQIPTAMERRSTGNSSSTSAREDGNIAEPPAACTTRKAMRVPALGARLHSSDPTVKIATDTRKTRLRPSLSAVRPASSSSEATVTL